MSEPTYTCPTCGAKSHDPADKAAGWCAHCRAYTGPSEDSRLPMVVVYLSPADYPGKYVARLHWASSGHVEAEPEPLRVAETYAELMEVIPPGMVRIPPHLSDAKQIVETWL